MRVIVCIIIGVLFAAKSFAQSADAERLKALMVHVEEAYQHHPDSLDFYVDKAVPLAQKLNDISSETKAVRLKAVKIFLNGDYNRSEEIFMQMTKKAGKYPPFHEQGVLYYEFAGIYSKNGYIDIAVQYIKKGQDIAGKLNDRVLYADGCNRMGVICERKQDLDSALFYYQLSLENNQKAGELLATSYSMENIAGIYGQRKQVNKALEYEKQVLAIRRSVGDKFAITIAMMNIAEMFEDLKKHDSAIYYAQQTMKLADTIGFTDGLKYGNQFLSGIYERMGDYKTALEYQHKYSELNQSLFNDKNKQIADLNAKYETEKNEEKIKQLGQLSTIQTLQIKQRNYLLLLAVAILIAGAVIAYLYYNRRKVKEQIKLQKAISKQQELTAWEVIHAEERERRRIAADLHDGVGQLLSAALININNLFTKVNIDATTEPLANKTLALVTESYDELRQISHQMIPNALVKAGLGAAVKELIIHIDQSKLVINLDIVGLNDRLGEEVETILYRVIQESINNVIKHAAATKLQIQLIKDEEGVAVTIEDNGIGFDLKNIKSDGIGLKNMISRIRFHQGTIDIDSAPGKGTLIAIYMPIA